MDYSVSDVARFVVNYADKKNKNVTNMKLQKILFYLQGFCYRQFNEPLFHAEFEAWPYGPVIRRIYIDFSMFGSSEIPCYNDVIDFIFYKSVDKDELENYEGVFEPKIIEFLKNILDRLLEYSAMHLVRATHKEGTPWKKVYDKNSKKIIPEKEIELYFTRS
ncbi:MAG: DUF4065 domain-containing protein [Peptoniphilus sp.]|uniref:Panacea domain-containing protein n=1 Tax=Peptoniphilus sp. TaxID=1971214 RepID=UPI002A74CA26|nr:type II toxin-antitoxin system antitoxin SocA domain-containing protein [Peptoniphilus sp.]MDY2987565.1 DUF4065 domain-containing protein [Peptoniphilus sp.]